MTENRKKKSCNYFIKKLIFSLRMMQQIQCSGTFLPLKKFTEGITYEAKEMAVSGTEKLEWSAAIHKKVTNELGQTHGHRFKCSRQKFELNINHSTSLSSLPFLPKIPLPSCSRILKFHFLSTPLHCSQIHEKNTAIKDLFLGHSFHSAQN